MSKTARALVLMTPLVGLTLFAPPSGASEGHEVEVIADLDPIEGSGVHGDGHAEVEFNRHGVLDEIEVKADGLLPDHPHAVHIHFGETAEHECPTLEEDMDDSGHLNTSEGAREYGPVVVSLTTTGDVSAESVLAVDRFSTAPGGEIDYSRGVMFEASDEVREGIMRGDGVVVVHGVDYNGNGTYDFDAGVSDLDPSLPTEATDPVMCGELNR